jgi:hypothetical protein
MKIFISWSGMLSHQIAKELLEWFPSVINELEPFVSSENIKKGGRWVLDIFSELEKSNFGIVCLTKENLNEPWILFEAGALSKNISQSKVSCFMFDGLKQEDIEGPLSLFQNTKFEKEDFRKLVDSINNALGERKISSSLLNKSFDKWYPELEEKIKNITDNYTPFLPKKEEGENKLNEILRTTKFISNVVTRLRVKLPPESLDLARFTDEDELVYSDNGNNHPVKITINPINDEDKILKKIVITKKGLDISNSDGRRGRGILIEILFYSENDMFWTLTFHFHKGNTYVTTDIADLPEEEADLLRNETIWRD